MDDTLVLTITEVVYTYEYTIRRDEIFPSFLRTKRFVCELGPFPEKKVPKQLVPLIQIGKGGLFQISRNQCVNGN